MRKKLIALIGLTVITFVIFGGLPRPPEARAAGAGITDSLKNVNADVFLDSLVAKLNRTAFTAVIAAVTDLADSAGNPSAVIAGNAILTAIRDTAGNVSGSQRTAAVVLAAVRDSTGAISGSQRSANTTLTTVSGTLTTTKDTLAAISGSARSLNTSLGTTNTNIAASTAQLTTLNVRQLKIDSTLQVPEEQVVTIDAQDHYYTTFNSTTMAAGGAALWCTSNSTGDSSAVRSFYTEPNFRESERWQTYRQFWPRRQLIKVQYVNARTVAGGIANTDSANASLALMVSDSAGGPWIEADRVYLRGADWASNSPQSTTLNFASPGKIVYSYVWTPPYAWHFWLVKGQTAQNDTLGFRKIERVGTVSVQR